MHVFIVAKCESDVLDVSVRDLRKYTHIASVINVYAAKTGKKEKEGFILVANNILSCHNVAKHSTLFQYCSRAAYKINEVVT